MYDHKLYNLFDKYVDKYKERIVSDWTITKYKNRCKDSLKREEILDALNIFRGKYGTSYIYFFKYPPTEKLGPKMKNLLKYKDIYKIDINNEQVQKNIIDIFYGYDKSNSDNQLLTKEYYENISEKDYFAKYNDNLILNFSMLNHIGIAFKDNYCLKDFLKKIN